MSWGITRSVMWIFTSSWGWADRSHSICLFLLNNQRRIHTFFSRKFLVANKQHFLVDCSGKDNFSEISGIRTTAKGMRAQILGIFFPEISVSFDFAQGLSEILVEFQQFLKFSNRENFCTVRSRSKISGLLVEWKAYICTDLSACTFSYAFFSDKDYHTCKYETSFIGVSMWLCTK